MNKKNEKIDKKLDTKDNKKVELKKVSSFKKKKKIKKNITTGIAYVYSTFNNTIISIADENGNVTVAEADGKPFIVNEAELSEATEADVCKKKKPKRRVTQRQHPLPTLRLLLLGILGTERQSLPPLPPLSITPTMIDRSFCISLPAILTVEAVRTKLLSSI